MNATYTLQFPGLTLHLQCDPYPGAGDPDSIGEARWAFPLEALDWARGDAPAIVNRNYNGLGQAFDTALGSPDDDDGETYAGDYCTSNADAAIAVLCAMLARGAEDSGDNGEPRRAFTVEWHGECGAFWAFHDLTHALEDFSCDPDSATVELADGGPLTAWAEDRVNLEGARRAHRAGVPLAEILSELAALRGAFKRRFPGDESSALEDFLDGLEGTEDAQARHAARVAAIVADILDCATAEGEDLDTLRERAWEHCEGVNLSTLEAAEILACTSNADRGEDYADGDSTALDSRAFGALLGDVEDALAEAFEDRACSECSERLPARGAAVCSDCARGLEDDAPLHLRIFAHLPGLRAACGAKGLEPDRCTADARQVTCPDCAGRVVVALEEPEPPELDGLRVRARGHFAKGLQDGRLYTLRKSEPFQGEDTYRFMAGRKIAARFGASSVRSFLRCVARGDGNGLELADSATAEGGAL